VAGLFLALLVTIRLPVSAPCIVGLNASVTVQLVLAASTPVHPSATTAKSPEVATLLMVSPTEFEWSGLHSWWRWSLRPGCWRTRGSARGQATPGCRAREVNRLRTVRTARGDGCGAGVVPDAGGGESQPDLA